MLTLTLFQHVMLKRTFPAMLKLTLLTTPLSSNVKSYTFDHTLFEPCWHWLFDHAHPFSLCYNRFYLLRSFPAMLKQISLTTPPFYNSTLSQLVSKLFSSCFQLEHSIYRGYDWTNESKIIWGGSCKPFQNVLFVSQ
jgi:hypothetical protein